MGCGGSKSESGREGVSSKLPPVLRRRFEEIRGRRNAAEQGTLSKKELLQEAVNEDDQSVAYSRNLGNVDNDRNSVCSPEESNLRVTRVTPEPEPEAEIFEDAFADVKEEKEEEKLSVEETEAGQDDEQCDDEEEVYRLSNVECRDEYLCPSSPSFRVYCTEPLDSYMDEDDSKDDDETSQSQKSQGDLQGGHQIVASENPNAALETKIKEKRKKGKRFNMVMCKGRRPAAIKSLMNVTSCYHSSSSRHDKARLLAPKSTEAS